MKQAELDWFRPLWRRVAVTAFITIWFVWETLWTKDQLWIAVTGAALAYAVWNFFIRFKDRSKTPEGDGDDGKPEA